MHDLASSSSSWEGLRVGEAWGELPTANCLVLESLPYVTIEL